MVLVAVTIHQLPITAPAVEVGCQCHHVIVILLDCHMTPNLR